MIYDELNYCVSNVNFKVSISDYFFKQINEYMKKSIGEKNIAKMYFPKTIHYIIDEAEFSKRHTRLMNNNLCEKVEYFKETFCYRHCIDNDIWICEEHNEWIIILSNNSIYIYISQNIKMCAIYLLRILRCLAYGYNEEKKMVFLHAASVYYKNSGIIIMGEKGSGKTTMLVNYICSNADIISNDRIFLDKDLNIISFPQSLRVGKGTFEKMDNLKQYFIKNNFYRKQDDESMKEFKYLITIDEMHKIFGNSYIVSKKLEYVIIPQIQIGSDKCQVELIDDESVKRDIFNKNCFTPIDESFRYEWIYSNKMNIEDKIENKEFLWKKLRKKNFFRVVYGTELETEKIIDKVTIAIKSM